MSDAPDDRTGDHSSDDHSSQAPVAHDTSANDGAGDASDVDSGDPPDDGTDEEFDDPPIYESTGSGRGRDVEVPMRVYKTVTVFSTLIAVVCVVAGFIVLDRATGRATLPLAEVDPVMAILGIAVILFGATTYAFGTRFRARGMGRSKNDDDESADNG